MKLLTKEEIIQVREKLEKYRIKAEEILQITEEEIMDIRDVMTKKMRKRYAEMSNERIIAYAQEVWCGAPRVDCLLTELAKRLKEALNEMASK